MLHSATRLSRSTFSSSSALTWTRTSRLVLSMFSDAYFDRCVYGTLRIIWDRFLLDYSHVFLWKHRMENSHVISAVSFVSTWLTIDSPYHPVGIYRDSPLLLGSVYTSSGQARVDHSPHVFLVIVQWSAHRDFMTLDSRNYISMFFANTYPSRCWCIQPVQCCRTRLYGACFQPQCDSMAALFLSCFGMMSFVAWI